MRHLRSAFAWLHGWLHSRTTHASAMRQATEKTADLQAKLAYTENQSSQYAADVRHLQDKIHDLERTVRLLEGDREVYRSQLEMFAAWEAKLLARLEAEAAIESGRKVRALEPMISNVEFSE